MIDGGICGVYVVHDPCLMLTGGTKVLSDMLAQSHGRFALFPANAKLVKSLELLLMCIPPRKEYAVERRLESAEDCPPFAVWEASLSTSMNLFWPLSIANFLSTTGSNVHVPMFLVTRAGLMIWCASARVRPHLAGRGLGFIEESIHTCAVFTTVQA